MDKTIIHVDMDAFFAAVEQLDFPEYRGMPVIVGADPRDGRGRGVVCASSYEARKYGIHSAMPISKAYSLCRHGVYLRPRFHRYSELSEGIMDILGEFSPLVEQISIDEAFLDCTSTERLFGPPDQLGPSIKQKIKEVTGLTASVGIAPNKSIAKIASDMNKPDGLTICPAGSERRFLAPLPVNRLWGAGPRTVEILRTRGLTTVSEIASMPVEVLENIFGKQGRHLWELANGIDERPVCTECERKSYSEELTFGEDMDSDDHVEQTLLNIADSVSRRMRRASVRGRTVTLKIRLAGFETYTRSITLPEYVDGMKPILSTGIGLYRRFDRQGKRVRLVGLGVSNLLFPGQDDSCQLTLFQNGSSEGVGRSGTTREHDLLLDGLKERYGEKITRATLLGKNNRHER